MNRREFVASSTAGVICSASENRPTPETSNALREELLFQRATQTYLWALPLINPLGMKVGW